jgi:predicted RNA-binding Zn-ribbon protein involved in translation (DUF1610 family)
MVGKHPCPECGANLEWNARAQSLKCPYCGTVVPWSEEVREELGQAVVEQDLAEALRNPQNGRGWGPQRYEVQCQNCRAISVFVDGRVAQRCDFCGSPSIVAHEERSDAITPQSILPFKVSDGQIRDRIRQWYGSRWFAPNKLKHAALTDTLHGVYLPYWTFDARVHARWRAEAGHYYYETRTVTRNGRTETVQERRVRWVPAAGELSRAFDDTLVSATQGLHPTLLRRIEPFPTTDLRPYDRGYVSGWVVEQYQLDLVGAAERSRAEMDAQVREACGRDVPGDTYRNLEVAATYTDQTFKHTLLPVWLLHYDYGRKSYQVVVNGVTGAIAGEQPYSWIKIFFATLAFIIVALTLFVLMEQ